VGTFYEFYPVPFDTNTKKGSNTIMEFSPNPLLFNELTFMGTSFILKIKPKILIYRIKAPLTMSSMSFCPTTYGGINIKHSPKPKQQTFF